MRVRCVVKGRYIDILTFFCICILGTSVAYSIGLDVVVDRGDPQAKRLSPH